MRIENVPAALLDEAVREQLFGRNKPYGMPISGYADDIKKLSVARARRPSIALLRAQQRRADRRRRHHDRRGAQARREVLRADPARARSSRARRPARGRHRPAAARGARRRTRRRAALVARLPGAVLSRRARRSMPMRCRCWRACSAAARPAGCGARWWSTARSRCRPSAGYSAGAASASPRSSIAVQPGARAHHRRGRGGGRRLEMKQAARWRRHARRRSSGRRTSCWPRRSIAQDSLASGPRLYGNALATGGTMAEIEAWPQRIAAVTPADVVAAARHVWRDDGRGDLAADAGGGQAMRRCRVSSRRWSSAVVWRLALPARPARSTSRKSPRRSASRPGWSRTRATPVVALSFSFAGGTASDPDRPARRHQPHGDAADRRRRPARRAGLQAAPGGCLGRRSASAPRSTGCRRLAARPVGQPRRRLRAAAAGPDRSRASSSDASSSARAQTIARHQPGAPAAAVGRRRAP